MGWGTGSVLGCVSVAVVFVGLNATGRTAPSDVAPPKTTLSGVKVEGKSSDQVQKLAEELRGRLLALPITIRYGKRLEKTTAAKLGGACDAQAATSAVFTPAQSNGLVDSITDRFTGPEARDVALSVKFQPELVSKALMRFAIRIGAEPQEPRVTKVGGKLKILPPRPGRELDPEALCAALEKAFQGQQLLTRVAASLEEEPSRPRWLAAQKPVEIPALTREAKGRIQEEQLKEITATLVSFSTSLGGSSRNRVLNIQIACKAIDGKVLLPGDTFSYNDVVGPRVPSAGYKDAPVILNGELSRGIAGGICQVSSTLYNAALLSDMKIVRRRHHSHPVHYLPAGRDATVVDGAIDFRFQNPFQHPVAIDGKVAGGRVVFHLYGHPDDKRQVQILCSAISRVPARSRTVSDPKLPKGKRVVSKSPKSGRRVTVSRVVKKDGAIIRREVVSRDYYPAQTGLIRVGTRELPKKDPEGPGAEPASSKTSPEASKPTPSGAG